MISTIVVLFIHERFCNKSGRWRPAVKTAHIIPVLLTGKSFIALPGNQPPGFGNTFKEYVKFRMLID